MIYGPGRGLLMIYGLGKVKYSPVEVYLLVDGLMKAVLLWVWCTVSVIV